MECTSVKKNMGAIDRIVRTAAAVVIVALYFGGQISGTAAILLGVVAVAFLLTSLVSWCPAYLPFGLSTRRG
jgi:predicted PurR-regulated permease PerM